MQERFVFILRISRSDQRVAIAQAWDFLLPLARSSALPRLRDTIAFHAKERPPEKNHKSNQTIDSELYRLLSPYLHPAAVFI
jgi:hypothetical protein